MYRKQVPTPRPRAESRVPRPPRRTHPHPRALTSKRSFPTRPAVSRITSRPETRHGTSMHSSHSISKVLSRGRKEETKAVYVFSLMMYCTCIQTNGNRADTHPRQMRLTRDKQSETRQPGSALSHPAATLGPGGTTSPHAPCAGDQRVWVVHIRRPLGSTTECECWGRRHLHAMTQLTTMISSCMLQSAVIAPGVGGTTREEQENTCEQSTLVCLRSWSRHTSSHVTSSQVKLGPTSVSRGRASQIAPPHCVTHSGLPCTSVGHLGPSGPLSALSAYGPANPPKLPNALSNALSSGGSQSVVS